GQKTWPGLLTSAHERAAAGRDAALRESRGGLTPSAGLAALSAENRAIWPVNTLPRPTPNQENRNPVSSERRLLHRERRRSRSLGCNSALLGAALLARLLGRGRGLGCLLLLGAALLRLLGGR